MEKLLACMFIATAVSACASWPENPSHCFASSPLVTPADAAQAKALNYVKRHQAAGCRATGVECHLQLEVRPTGEIAIMASQAFLSGDPLACTHLDGGFSTYIFSSLGDYERVEHGL